MKTGMASIIVACLSVMLIAPAFGAEEQDLSALYELTTEGTPQKLKVGEKGTFILSIKTKNGSHVSGEAPLKLELSAQGLKLAKKKLTYADSITAKAAGPRYPDPRFEIPFTAEVAGKGGIDANLTFFICTENLCARQSKQLHLPVDST